MLRNRENIIKEIKMQNKLRVELIKTGQIVRVLIVDKKIDELRKGLL